MSLFFLLPALVLFKLMTIFLRKVKQGLVHDNVDEEDESGDGLLPHQGNCVITRLILYQIYRTYSKSKNIIVIISKFLDHLVHMRELRRNESFRRMHRATSRED